MKFGKKVTAFIIALVLTVYGLPVFPAAQASPADQTALDVPALLDTGAEAQPDEPEALPDGAIRFIQKVEYNEDGTVKRDDKNNPVGGFDPGTGILTMCLQVKPEALLSGGGLSDGVFLFQTDLNTMVPVTRPRNGETRQQILGRAGKGAIVTSSVNPEIKNLLAAGRFEQLSGTFGDLMSPAASFNSNHTGLLVAKDAEDPALLDCYFQFRYDGDSTAPSTTPGEEGYVTVMEFDFQCYAGTYPIGDPNAGQQKPAASMDALFQGSIRIPDESDVERICQQFSYEENGGQTAVTLQNGASVLLYNSTGDQECFYYGTEPVLSQWRKLKANPNGEFSEMSRNTWWSAEPTHSIAGSAADQLWYGNMQVKYVITGFSVGYENTFVKEGDPAGDSDSFTIPSSETDGYPRYTVPYLTRDNENDQNKNWIPDAYLKGDGSRVQMKYFIGTEYMEGSVSSPEHEGMENVMRNVTWEFLLDGDKRLESCGVKDDPDAAETKLEVNDGTAGVKQWTAKTFLIKDDSLDEKYQGKKLWKLYDENGNYRMTCPVGVVLEMLPTEISYYDRFIEMEDPEQQEEERQKKRTVTALAPQLHVTNEAADPESAIWFVQSSVSSTVTAAPIYFWACYDYAGAGFHSVPLRAGLYRDKTAVPTTPVITMDGLMESKKEGVDGEFYVGTEMLTGGNETTQDAIATEKFTVRSALQDQYGLEISGKYNTLELVPTEETAAALLAANRDQNGPFMVERKTTPPNSNSYTIKI